MAGREPTVAELATLTFEERVAYFLAHPLPDTDERNAQFIARHRAQSVLRIAKRDIEQAIERDAQAS